MTAVVRSTRPTRNSKDTTDLSWQDAVKFAATVVAINVVATVAIRCIVSAIVDVVVEENV
jgi:uncharacterized membrane protein (DUF4010 family)